jgi:hypothetical protein
MLKSQSDGQDQSSGQCQSFEEDKCDGQGQSAEYTVMRSVVRVIQLFKINLKAANISLKVVRVTLNVDQSQ